MNDTIADRVKQINTVMNIVTEVKYCTWRDIDQEQLSRTRGVYVIYDTTQVYYVGRGYIAARQKHHREKFLGEFRHARDTRGFRQFRELYGIVNTQDFLFAYCVVTSETAAQALEAGLIHLLQPLANDETNQDQNR